MYMEWKKYELKDTEEFFLFLMICDLHPPRLRGASVSQIVSHSELSLPI
jgi:hypothetical protein